MAFHYWTEIGETFSFQTAVLIKQVFVKQGFTVHFSIFIFILWQLNPIPFHVEDIRSVQDLYLTIVWLQWITGKMSDWCSLI